MFGLMLKKSCNTQEAEREHYRLHYCGTCKAIGKQYSQSARMLLNLDSVFLAELLTALSQENTAQWQESYHAYNCFASGGEGEELPFPLRYAAATNVLFAALKTEDNIKDRPSFLWKTARKWLNSDYQKAKTELEGFGVNMSEIRKWLEVQEERESGKGIANKLAYFAEPTARITAILFSQAAMHIGQDAEKMYQLGYEFGELMYGLDALEDVEKDTKTGEFNAFVKCYSTISKENKEQLGEYLFAISDSLQQEMQQLPIPIAQQVEFAQRLNSNLAFRITNAIEGKNARHQNVKQSFLERISLRSQNAKAFANQMLCNKETWTATPQYGLYYAAAFVAPQLPKALPSQPPASAVSNTSIGIWAIMTVLAGLWFIRNPFLREFKRIYLLEFKRIKAKILKNNSDNLALWVIVALIAALLIIVVALIAACVTICNNFHC